MNSAQLQCRRCRGFAGHAQLRRGGLRSLVRVHAAPEQPRGAAAPGPSHSLDHHAAPAAPLPLESEPAPLRISRRIAAARAVESRRHRQQASNGSSSSSSDSSEAPLFVDPYAELLAGGRAPAGASPAQVAADVISTAYTDELLLRAVGLSAVNGISEGDYRQVVLLGDALDTRPYRLPWPPGTALFLVAPAQAHAAAEAALASQAAADIAAAVAAETTVPASPTSSSSSSAASSSSSSAASSSSSSSTSASSGAAAPGSDSAEAASTAAAVSPAGGRAKATAKAGGRAAKRPAGPRPPPGCLVRRVSVDLRPAPGGGGAPDLLGPLTAAGFRGDRLSVWGLQGIAGLGLDQQDVAALLAEAANAAAYHSLLLGELPGELGASQAANAIAEAGLLGAPLALGTDDVRYGRWQREWGPPEDPEQPQRWVFASQQVRLSIAQMDTYTDHGAAAAELDEDFFDNFS
ncbi:hypothetical protein HYH02_002415 [Chlamydomonas schloesseri]|uniref:Uncharacterized protein n=1 Tax=Chlamydomonas schloesseri TaxID=2026947 RepID=A0A836BB74_9CHLO|nr:hypothetical protein HYH02_002415 [Chlamydomonas schloesseri]|eukprot:KAG2453083.1 hypothetical protein HYH02_002415 [Chlamydomonas schloesseri]